MNIFDTAGEPALRMELVKRRYARLLAVEAELQDALPGHRVGYATASMVMDIEEVGGVVDLETGVVYWQENTQPAGRGEGAHR